jgi:hypothetical protein
MNYFSGIARYNPAFPEVFDSRNYDFYLSIKSISFTSATNTRALIGNSYTE